MLNIIKPGEADKEITPLRGTDAFGSGSYKAPRGTRGGKPRYHNGIDYLSPKNSAVFAVKSGIVTKIGLPYTNAIFRYVEIKDSSDYLLRYFYIDPLVEAGDEIEVDGIIGTSQDQCIRYKGMPNHVHFEIKNNVGRFVNPSLYLRGQLEV